MDFATKLRETLNEDFNHSVTENGALGYATTGKELLDLNFAVSSLRHASDIEIENRFAKAFYEDRMLAIKWLFYAADVRGGLGERRLFRVCMSWLAENQEKIAAAVLPLIPEYTRWDNVICLFNTSLKTQVIELISKQLTEDMDNVRKNKPISLCAKWMPSITTSSQKTVSLAKAIVKELKVGESVYRKMLSKLRKYLDVVEVKMSANEWGTIKYETVPSRANLIYNSAFLKRDTERRREYLDKLEKGEVKINSSVLFPHDIVHKYGISRWDRNINSKDTALEAMWKGLPNYVKDNSNTLCVVDGSGSMESRIGSTNISALEVANALGIYFSERCSGVFKDKFITFGADPQFVDLSNQNTLRDKLAKAYRYDDCSNTNIQKTFNLILQTAIRNNMKQEDMPKNILIISDMEFDCATLTGDYWWGAPSYTVDERLFSVIEKDFRNAGYKMPRLVFWNVKSRTGTIPVKQNELGVALVSGFSPAVTKMVLSNKLDPFECLLEQINGERYAAVGAAVEPYII